MMSAPLRILSPQDFSFLSTCRTAASLPGKLLLRRENDGELSGGIITETEAYTADDDASHSRMGPTRRNRSMFMAPGTVYVYLIYGMHHCLNLVTAEEGVGEAVLIRGFYPVFAVDRIASRRRAASREPGRRPLSPSALFRLCNGPAKLCQALDIDMKDDGAVFFFPGNNAAGTGAGGEGSIALAELPLSRDLSLPGTDITALGPRIGLIRNADVLRRWTLRQSPAELQRRAVALSAFKQQIVEALKVL